MSRPLLDDVVLKLIDAKLVLNGHVTSKDIYRHVGLSRQKVSRIFQKYLEANPNAMKYIPSQKKYVASDKFKPSFLENTNAGDYIEATIIVFGIHKEQ